MSRHAAGAAAEHLVVFDLYRRGVKEITWPDHGLSTDDLHARLGVGWRSLQVKTAPENCKTGKVIKPGRGPILSEIIALVGFASGKVRYVANDGAPLPDELSEKKSCRYFNTTALGR